MFADLHCDTVTKAYDEGKSLRENDLHIDLVRRANAGGGIQNFALFLDSEKLREGEDILEKTKEYLEFYNLELAQNADLVEPVRNLEEIQKCIASNKTAAVLTLEEGAICKGEIENLQYFHENGVRMMTLTWNYDNELAASCTTSDDYGLTKLGIQFVEEMERLGIIVDVSHLSDKGIYRLGEIAKKPFVASHSNVRALCDHRRNLSDKMIRIIADKGGVVGLNLYEHFLCPGFGKLSINDQSEIITSHVKHLINIGGEEVVALGGDFDGIDTNQLMPEISKIPTLRKILNSKDIPDRVLEKMFFGNVMRVYEQL